jgi:demethylmenaquinone methyltransferase/2-methoxy-6-polyprenyl-1,4-benzoquinol methylase
VSKKASVPERVVPHPPLRDYYDREEDRRGFVDGIFDATAGDYDWINRLMSFGSGTWYRREALKRAGLRRGMSVLDVCVGTGLVSRVAGEVVGDDGWVIGLDASMEMLHEAKGLSAGLVQGYVEQLPVADERFDFVTMGYALRHVADLETVFRECSRVLKPGGTLLILELTRPRSPWLYHIARLHLRYTVPLIARLRSREAYTLMRYFWDTIESCVPPEAVVQSLGTSGFGEARRHVIMGFFSEYVAVKSLGAGSR